MRAEDIIERLGLEPLPVEGGFFRRYWAGPGDPPAGSAIWYLLTDGPDGNSRFHRLTLDEVWHRYFGDPAEWCCSSQRERAATSDSALTSTQATS